MGDDVDAREVINRLNERIGKANDAFARLKLEELRDELREAVDGLQSANKQYKVIVAGHKQVESDVSESVLKRTQQQIEQQNQQVTRQAAFLSDLLDAAEGGRDLREYIEERQERQRRQMQQQMPAGAGGPMGPQ